MAAFGIALPAQERDAIWFMAVGPLAGGLARGDAQWSCCGAFSLSLLPWGLSALALGVAAQWLIPTQALIARRSRLALWFAGWVGWFACGVLSCLHAFS